METVLEKKNVILGKENYEYIKTATGDELLTRNVEIGNQKINVVLCNRSKENTNEIEKYIISVLSDLYIQRNLKKFM